MHKKNGEREVKAVKAYRQGAEARKNFETTMTKLFRAPKPKKQPKKKAASKGKKS